MPQRAGSACTRHGCPGIVRDRVCSVCGPRVSQWRRQQDAERGNATDRGYDWRWQQVRALKVQRNPVCERCAKQGVTSVTFDVHHIVPIRVAPELRLVMSNLMSVCRQCHAELEAEARATA